jgi:HD-GYP domain-containing protein (c-di-GMP phosphodiesterase class II)
MKTYNVQKKLSKEARQQLERIIETHEKYRNSYFFNPSGNANGRRRNEANFKKNNPDVIFYTSKGPVKVSMNYRESCQNVYYKLYVKLNDEYKNISLIKKILNKKLQ